MNLIPIFERAQKATLTLQRLSQQKIDAVLSHLSEHILRKSDYILTANGKDLAAMEPSNPLHDRLKLDAKRLQGIAADMKNIASLHSPVGELLSETTRPNGMTIRKVRVPFGVVGVIYEARPNVSFDVFSLCFKSANVCLLKGGHDAKHSNEAIVATIKEVLQQEEVDDNAVTLLPSTHEAATELLEAQEYVDLLIPRGGKSLIDYVKHNALVPVIETGAGICHTYFDEYGDTEKGRNIVFNAKTRRVSVCNALDCLVIHASRLKDLQEICNPLACKNVTIYADPRAYDALSGLYPADLLQHANETSFGTEFLDYKMAIKTVDTFQDALQHIGHYTSHHSEAIITENDDRAAMFSKTVDAACVYHNVSTAFTDGAQFGFGAEMGISTQKLHARGPMALPELTTYKYIITGNGQTREQ